MNVVKRDGRKEPVSFDKITQRIDKLCYGLSTDHVCATQIAQKSRQSLMQAIAAVQAKVDAVLTNYPRHCFIFLGPTERVEALQSCPVVGVAL